MYVALYSMYNTNALTVKNLHPKLLVLHEHRIETWTWSVARPDPIGRQEHWMILQNMDYLQCQFFLSTIFAHRNYSIIQVRLGFDNKLFLKLKEG